MINANKLVVTMSGYAGELMNGSLIHPRLRWGISAKGTSGGAGRGEGRVCGVVGMASAMGDCKCKGCGRRQRCAGLIVEGCVREMAFFVSANNKKIMVPYSSICSNLVILKFFFSKSDNVYRF